MSPFLLGPVCYCSPYWRIISSARSKHQWIQNQTYLIAEEISDVGDSKVSNLARKVVQPSHSYSR